MYQTIFIDGRTNEVIEGMKYIIKFTEAEFVSAEEVDFKEFEFRNASVDLNDYFKLVYTFIIDGEIQQFVRSFLKESTELYRPFCHQPLDLVQGNRYMISFNGGVAGPPP
jgi:hypothetical protein